MYTNVKATRAKFVKLAKTVSDQSTTPSISKVINIAQQQFPSPFRKYDLFVIANFITTHILHSQGWRSFVRALLGHVHRKNN